MVESLVKKENGVYRNKLLDLAQHSLDKAQNRQRIPTEGLTAANVVDTAWGDVRYGWVDSSTDETLIQDGSCAYTWKAEEGGQPFPLICISSSFRENDYVAGQPSSPTTDLRTMDDLMTSSSREK